MDLFIFRLLDEDHAEWLVANRQNNTLTAPERGSLADAAKRAAAHTALWVVSGKHVSLHEAKVPSQKKRQIQQALPFALEDELIADIDTQHFSWMLDGERVIASVCDKQWLKQRLDYLQEQGLYPKRALPDSLLVPKHGDEPRLWRENNQAILLNDPMLGLNVDEELLPTLLTNLATQTDATLQVYSDAETPVSWPGEMQQHPANFSVLCKSIVAGIEFNLLHDEFKPRRSSKQKNLPWLPSAIAAGVLLLVATFYYAMINHQSSQYSKDLYLAILDEHRQAFPEQKRVRNPVKFMKEQLAIAEGGHIGSNIMQQLGNLAPKIMSAENINIQQINARDDQLNIELNIDTLDHLDQLKQNIESSGQYVVELRADTDEKIVTGVLTIKEVN